MFKILFFLACLNACIGRAQKDVPDYVTAIKTVEEYNQLQGRPLSSKYGDVASLKVVYRIKDKQIFFIHSTRFPYHLNFCEDILKYYKGSFNFNYENYTKSDKREFLLANINHYQSNNLYTLEFSVTDQIAIGQIEILHAAILQHFKLTDDIKLFLNTENLETRFKNSGSQLPITDVNDIYGNQTFQAIQTGVCYGKLRFLDTDSGHKEVQLYREDIVVMKGIPNELSLVSGVIASQFQTPLSHISILCKNRKTPFTAVKNAWNLPEIKALEGTFVKLSVTSNGYVIESAHKDSVAAYIKQLSSPSKQFDLKSDYSDKYVIPVRELGHRDLDRIGSKAANFAELYKVCQKKEMKAKVPENAFTIPFGFYSRHIISCGVDSLIALCQNNTNQTQSEQSELLSLIRQKIKQSPIDSQLIAMVTKQITSNPNFTRYRFRSSTNAEDIEGFNGAGLYTSKTGILGDSIKTFERAIKKVWASVWNDRAYFERQYYGISQQHVAMGILVHRAFPDENANGVAITRNIYRPKNLGFVLNIQKGDIPVVDPPAGVICDQLVCYSDTDNTFYAPKKIVEYISKSNQNNNQPVLRSNDVVKITRALAHVKKHFYRKVAKNWLKYDYTEFALDIEFKVDQNNTIYVKQARPFN